MENEEIKGIEGMTPAIFLSGVSDRYGEKGAYIVLRDGASLQIALNELSGATIVVSGCVVKTDILGGYLCPNNTAIRAIAKENKKHTTTEEED